MQRIAQERRDAARERRLSVPCPRRVGKYGSFAVIERFIKSLKAECVRLLPVVPLAQAALGRELDAYIT